jgi:ABC-2 type transport system permease protein
VVLTYVLPWAPVTYMPTSVVLHKPGAHGWWALSPVMAAVAGVGFAALVWRIGIRRYKGAGQ